MGLNSYLKIYEIITTNVQQLKFGKTPVMATELK